MEENTNEKQDIIVENEETIINEEKETVDMKFCIYCGGHIVPDKGYCEKCGKSAIVEGQCHCVGCGEILKENQKFCMNCGKKVKAVVLSRGVDDSIKKVQNIGGKVKGIGKKGKIIGLIVVVLAILLAVGKPLLSNVFVSSEEYLKEANYEKAYKKAKKDEKEAVLLENLIAKICGDAKEDLKNADSFKLKEAFWDSEDSQLVLNIQGTNSFGGIVSSYWYYTFNKEDGEFKLWTTVSDFDEEEVYTWDDNYEKLEKILENSAKKSVKEIISDKGNKLSSDTIDRINDLDKQGILGDVKLLKEVELLYPSEAEEA